MNVNTHHGDCGCDGCEFDRLIDRGFDAADGQDRWSNLPHRPGYCPTCGLTRTRWQGCTDPYHDQETPT